MFSPSSRIVKALSVFAIAASTAFAATAPKTNPKINVAPRARIVDKIDNTKVVAVAGTHIAFNESVQDLGRMPANTTMSHLMLVLKSTDEQEYALHTLLDQQQDKNHANFHQWTTPETFGQYFGVAQDDIAKVTGWLTDGGFTIDNVAKGGRIITFSGTTGQVESLFHTEMHVYSVNGETHTANATDISIPAALSSVVMGPARLNDFKPKSDAKALKVKVDSTGQVTSATTWGGTPLTSVPGNSTFPNGDFTGGSDLSVIYDTAPLFAKGIQGQGVTLGIIGQTDVLLSDIQIYRTIYGLPINNYTRVQVGSDPGIIADDTESDLDLEVSGAMAPLANQIFYTSGNSYYGGGVDSAVEYVIEDNAADIFSMSYGQCEGSLGAAGNAFFAYVYEQAAAQGQSIFISTGDDGPDTCGAYYSASSPQTTGYTVNGLGSTAYNVAVGGTQFNEGATYSTPSTATTGTPYWGPLSTAIPYESALSFIPDQPWNESYFGTNTYGGLTGGGSGISFYYGTPSWQVGPGVPTKDPAPPAGSYEATIPASAFVVPGPHRYMPDVSLNASVYHDGTVLCSEGSCTLTASGGLNAFGIVGGTSVASPTMAGAQALINQMNGGRQGVPNYYYYRAAAVQNATKCVATNYVATAGCSFHDSQVGNNDVPAVRNSTTQEIGWNAGPQYDLAVGLDSPDVANLATTWSTINFNATTTSFTITPTTGGTPGGNYNVSVTVTPASGSGTPTGDVGIIAQALYGGLGWLTLSKGTATGTFTGLPGGTYCIYAHYGGDTTYGGSNSPCVTITVSQATPTVAAISESLVGTALTPTATFAYGTNVYINMGILPPGSGFGIPTGTLTVQLNNGVSNLPVYTTGVDPNGTTIGTTTYPGGAYFDAGLGLTTYDIASTYPVLAPGTYTANVSYSGDTTFKAASAPPFTFTVGAVSQAIKLTAGTPDITSGAQATLFATITTLDPTVGGVPAVGTVTFTDTTTNKVLGTAPMTNGAATFTTTAITQTGANSITASFAGTAGAVGGASYYGPVTSTAATVTVTTGTATTTTVAAQTATYQVLGTVPLVAKVATATSGTVYFFDNGVEIGTGTVGTANTATLNIATLTAGVHPITATYSGTSALSSSTSAVVNYTITQNTPSVGLSAQVNGNVGAGGYAMNAVLTLSPANGTKAPTPAPTAVVAFNDAANGAAAKTLGTATAAFLPNYEQYVANYVTTALVPGHHVLSAQLQADANYAAATSNTLTVAVGITSLSITSSTNNVGTGVPFTLSATVTPAIASATPIGGTVTFYDGAVSAGVIAGVAQVVNGVGSIATASLSSVGTHTINAVYSGDANYYTSSATLGYTLVSVTPGYTIAAVPTSVILPHSGSVTLTVTATSFGNYAGIGSLSCTNLPANTFCPYNAYQQFTFNGVNGTQSTVLVITAVSSQTAAKQSPVQSGLMWLPALFFGGLLALGRKRLTLRGRQIMMLLVLICGLVATNGCGSGAPFPTPTGTYPVTLVSNGTGANSYDPNLTTTAALSVQVQ